MKKRKEGAVSAVIQFVKDLDEEEVKRALEFMACVASTLSASTLSDERPDQTSVRHLQ